MLLQAGNMLAPSTPVIPTSVGVAILLAYAMDYAKRLEKLPRVSYYSNKVNTWLRFASSGIGTLGVSWVWSAAGTAHQLLITIPAFSALVAGLFHWAASYGLQHFMEIQLSQREVAQTAMREQQGPQEVVKPMGVPQP
jgi:hypothetical protein